MGKEDLYVLNFTGIEQEVCNSIKHETTVSPWECYWYKQKKDMWKFEVAFQWKKGFQVEELTSVW